MTWGNLPFLDRLSKVKEAGFTHYEFWPWRNKDIDAIVALEPRARPDARAVLGLSGQGIRPRNHQSRPGGGGTSLRRRSGRRVPVAKKLGVKKICVVAGEETKGYSREEQTQAVIAALKAGARIVEPEGITIILEPLNILVDHPRQLIVRSEHAALVLKVVGSPNVKMLFDIYHQQISEGNLTGNIRKYHDLIGYYQLADHPGRHQPTTGEINYPFVLWTIHETGYRDPIGMEMSPKGDPMEAFKAIRKVDALAVRSRDERIASVDSWSLDSFRGSSTMICAVWRILRDHPRGSRHRPGSLPAGIRLPERPTVLDGRRRRSGAIWPYKPIFDFSEPLTAINWHRLGFLIAQRALMSILGVSRYAVAVSAAGLWGRCRSFCSRGWLGGSCHRGRRWSLLVLFCVFGRPDLLLERAEAVLGGPGGRAGGQPGGARCGGQAGLGGAGRSSWPFWRSPLRGAHLRRRSSSPAAGDLDLDALLAGRLRDAAVWSADRRWLARELSDVAIALRRRCSVRTRRCISSGISRSCRSGHCRWTEPGSRRPRESCSRSSSRRLNLVAPVWPWAGVVLPSALVLGHVVAGAAVVAGAGRSWSCRSSWPLSPRR